MLLKQDHLIGLDIGSRSIKVADIVQGSNGLALKHFGMEPLPADTISEGVIEEPGVVVAAIRRLIADLKIKEKKVAISVSGYSVIIKKIVLAKMSEEELSQTIQFEAEQYIPFDVQDVNIDFHILGDSDQNPNQMNVMLVAAKKGVVDVYLDILTRSRLIPAVIDVDAFALENAFETNYLLEDGETMLVDIGANKMNISVLKEGVSALTRDVAMGGEQITREIASEFDLSFEKAEAAKLGTPNDKVSPGALEHIRTRCVSQWCNEVRRAIDFFYSTYADSEIKRIFLSGGAARTEGLIELLAVETSVDVELFNPFNELSVEVKHPDPDLLTVAPQAAICVGLALRRMDDK
jgi:type IV pilus assembly protein PilM